MTAKRTVPLGDGDIPWADELRRLLSGVKAPEVLASIETHCPGDGRNATARSVAALRRLAGEAGQRDGDGFHLTQYFRVF